MPSARSHRSSWDDVRITRVTPLLLLLLLLLQKLVSSHVRVVGRVLRTIAVGFERFCTMSPYGQCYLCMRCMSTSSRVLNWQHRRRQSSTLGSTDLSTAVNNLPLVKTQTDADELAMVAKATCITSRRKAWLRPGQSSSSFFVSFQTQDIAALNRILKLLGCL